jgi:hypothetical protein
MSAIARGDLALARAMVWRTFRFKGPLRGRIMRSIPSIAAAVLSITILLTGCASDPPRPTPVPLNDLPAAVKQGFVREFEGVQIERVERVPREDGRDFYRIYFTGNDGQEQRILYNPEGTRQTEGNEMYDNARP